jgi:hypothetical protein
MNTDEHGSEKPKQWTGLTGLTRFKDKLSIQSCKSVNPVYCSWFLSVCICVHLWLRLVFEMIGVRDGPE